MIVNSRSPWLPQSPAAGPPGASSAALTSAGFSSQWVNSYSPVPNPTASACAHSRAQARSSRYGRRAGRRPSAAHGASHGESASRASGRAQSRPRPPSGGRRARGRDDDADVVVGELAQRLAHATPPSPPAAPRRSPRSGRSRWSSSADASRPACGPVGDLGQHRDLPPADQVGRAVRRRARCRPAGRASRARRRSPAASPGRRRWRPGGRRGPPRAGRGRSPASVPEPSGPITRAPLAACSLAWSAEAVTNTRVVTVERRQRPPGPRAGRPPAGAPAPGRRRSARRAAPARPAPRGGRAAPA